ncbi:MAG: PhnD/SsuA/transferrin family substrate-binding protein, partial [Rhizobiaceae bacterium]|nr:PhnD/SsuA/transferrin family substrate-binding protein [Rhizobiaceae bacterium]
LFGQTCWGPMELGLADHVAVIGQPDYSAFEGGNGIHYASAVVMRRKDWPEKAIAPSTDGSAVLPLDRLRGLRLAFNGEDSMSGVIGLKRDLVQLGEGLRIFSGMVETGAHRASVRAVAEGRADVAAIDCRTWDTSRRFDSAARELVVAGWTARRKGLPYITALPLRALLPAVTRALTG